MGAPLAPEHRMRGALAPHPLLPRAQTQQLSALGVAPRSPRDQKPRQVAVARLCGGLRQRIPQARLNQEWGPRQGQPQLPETWDPQALLLQALLGTLEAQAPRFTQQWQDRQVEAQQQQQWQEGEGRHEQQGQVLRRMELGVPLGPGLKPLRGALVLLREQGQGWVLLQFLVLLPQGLHLWQGLRPWQGLRHWQGLRLQLQL